MIRSLFGLTLRKSIRRWSNKYKNLFDSENVVCQVISDDGCFYFVAGAFCRQTYTDWANFYKGKKHNSYEAALSNMISEVDIASASHQKTSFYVDICFPNPNIEYPVHQYRLCCSRKWIPSAGFHYGKRCTSCGKYSTDDAICDSCGERLF